MDYNNDPTTTFADIQGTSARRLYRSSDRNVLAPPPARHPVRALRPAPVCKELSDERVLVARFDGQWRQSERHGERNVVPDRSRRNSARVRRMGIVDPDRAVHQSPELEIGRTRLELHHQTVPRRPT